jgi:hypothetical protein
MSDHQATWVRLRKMGRQCFPDDPLAVEIAAREAFDAEESAAYAADLDARDEEQGVLEAACAATRLREELREELRRKAPAPAATRTTTTTTSISTTTTWTPTSSLNFRPTLRSRRPQPSKGR